MTVPRKVYKGTPEPAPEGAGAAQDIETLKRRYGKLAADKAAADRELELKQEHLERLKAEAREAFGTDDLDELKRALAQMEAENLKKRADYQEALDRIDADLRAVEERYGEASERT